MVNKRIDEADLDHMLLDSNVVLPLNACNTYKIIIVDH